MLDERIDSFRKKMHPAWDDLRERRLLRGVRRTLDERSVRRAVRRRAVFVAVPLVLAVAALVVAYATGVDFGRRQAMRHPTSATAPSPAETTAPVVPSAADSPEPEVRVLADGSRLELSASARVDVSTETPSRVELAQSGGRVRYQVAHVPDRAFVIRAGGVRVEVTGTVFVVSFEGDKIAIQVDAGRVRVSGPGKEAELGAGDELSMVAQPSAAADTASVRGATHGDPAAVVPSAAALIERADSERTAGDLSSAARTLREFVGRYPSDARAALAWFTLGKVERARGRPGDAARAFRMSGSLAPDGPLAEDALAEEAAAWAVADDTAKARAAVGRYLRRFPNGTHAARMRNLLE
jgi:transmembrane sensor